MGRTGLFPVLGLLVVAACSSGGGSAAGTTTTSFTSTTLATTTTTSPEDAVKAAYLAYWKMVDRIAAAPNGDDPEIPERTVDPRLTATREAFATSAVAGETTKTPQNALYKHVVQSVQIVDMSAVVIDCTIDDQVVFDRDGNIIDNAITTKEYRVTLVAMADGWKVKELEVTKRRPGVQVCGG